MGSAEILIALLAGLIGFAAISLLLDRGMPRSKKDDPKQD